jgi:hypothetical protein
MKARELKKILNNTRYTVAFYGSYIGIGSPLCHDLIKLDISTNKITYVLDTFHKGRSSIGSVELTFIWDKLHELVETGAISEIIKGNDVIENPIPVHTIRDGNLFSTVTDAYGWPNVTVEGYMMHDNDYFETKSEAIEYGIKEFEARAYHLSERLKELQSECSRVEFLIQDSNNVIKGLKLLTPLKGERINTMQNFDPKEGQAETQQATGQQAATESAAQDSAMEATQESAEEGSTEG